MDYKIINSILGDKRIRKVDISFMILFFVFSLTIPQSLYAQEKKAEQPKKTKFDLSGVVIDKETNKPIELATVILNSTMVADSDKNGHFTFFNLKKGKYSCRVMLLGYKPVDMVIDVDKDVKNLTLKMDPLSIGLEQVVVTAVNVPMGSTSRINESAIQHIQPKSVDDLLQLLPGSLTKNPNLNSLAQANIREIGSNDNNALGTAVIIDGAPVSNDGNLQALSPSMSGNASNTTLNGMANQTTSGRGVDMRTISPDNVESMTVIRGIPSVEYGNLTSGVVIIKTKTGVTPFEFKFKADPFSKMVYAGKGFALKRGGAVNAGIDWSQSFGDTRKRYLGYDRITATLGYSNQFKLAAKPFTVDIKGSVYSNVNNSKTDPQMAITSDRFKNKHVGFRINTEGQWKLNLPVVSNIDYSLMASWARQTDELHEYVASPRGMISNAQESGINPGIFLTQAYYSDYKIVGKPLNLFAVIKANKLIEFGNENYTNIKIGVDWRYDGNRGDGLVFDPNSPPNNTTSQTLRPRSFKDIPASNNLSFFLEDKLYAWLGSTQLTVQGGVRMTNMFLDEQKALQSNIFMAEPRINLSYQILNRRNNNLFSDFSLLGGAGISYKSPTLLYLYPDDAYFDMMSLSRVSNSDPTGTMALMTTNVIHNLANKDLKPAKSMKYEAGMSFGIGRINGMVTFFKEKHTNEFGFTSLPHYMTYDKYNLPDKAGGLLFENNELSYLDGTGNRVLAPSTSETVIATYSNPTNNMRTEKKGIEYSVDFGQIRPIRTSLVVDGAWFNIRRYATQPYYSSVALDYDYIKFMPSGSGSIQNRTNTNFRLITHIPKLKLIFSTTVQVVWGETSQNIWKDNNGKNIYQFDPEKSRYFVTPLGFYDKAGQYIEWQNGFEKEAKYSRMVSTMMQTAYDKEEYKPWVMLNFRLTKEIGKMLDLSFMANNFTGSGRWHTNKTTTGYKQIYPPLYFGAELRIKINAK